MPDLQANLRSVKQRIAQAAGQTGRQSDAIKLVVVTKTVPVELIEQIIQAGVTDLGENRVRDALPKIQALKNKYPEVRWHMIGHLQRNKVKQVLDNFDLLQAVDSERLAREIDAKAGQQGRVVPVLAEIKTSTEETKYGVPIDSAVEFVRILTTCQNIRVVGLMTMGPLTIDPEAARPCFRKLKDLSIKIKDLSLANIELAYLSMGMSNDFEVAIQEGSNMVRVGRAIFT